MKTKNRKGLFNTSTGNTIAGIVITALIILPMLGYIIYIGKVEPQVDIVDDKVEISAFLSTTIEFSAQEIESVELVHTLPKGRRVGGLGTSAHLRGNFNYEGYGKTKVFIYRKYPPYILIKLKNRHSVFINSQSQIKTQELYASFLALITET